MYTPNIHKSTGTVRQALQSMIWDYLHVSHIVAGPDGGNALWVLEERFEGEEWT